MSYKIKFIDSERFMANSLSNLVDNLTDRMQKIKYKDCDCFLEYENIKHDLIKFKCLSCNKVYSNKINQELKSYLRTQISFLIIILINLFCYQEKLFILMSTWMNAKSLMKQHYLEKKNFVTT